MALFLTIFLVGTISALQFDNTKDYDSRTKTAIITNSFGLGNEIASIKLTTPINVRVPLGYQEVAEFELVYYLDGNGDMNLINFYDLSHNDKEINRDFDYLIKKTRQIKKDDYTCSNKVNQNGSIENTCAVTGFHYEDEEYWDTFNLADLNKGESVTIGIFTDVQKGDYIEWIPTYFGAEITEWATWTADLNAGLISYWNFDEGAGTNADDVFSHLHNGTLISTPDWIGGILGTAVNFSIAAGQFVNITQNGNDFGVSGNENISINIWIYPNTSTISYLTDKLNNWVLEQRNLKMYIYFKETGGGFINDYETTNDVLNLGEWQMITFVYNGTGDFAGSSGVFYINGTVYPTTKTLEGAGVTEDTSSYARISSATDPFDGGVDELSIWNATLTPAQITNLYNGGTGITYESFHTPVITLNSPVDVYNSTNQTIIFNGTVEKETIGIANVSIILDGLYNETNSSGFNDTFYYFTKTFADGGHNWTYESCNANGYCINVTTRSFNISSFSQNSFTYNSSTYETATESFILNISTRDDVIPTNPYLWYDGTSYGATITNGDNYYLFTKSLDIPTISSDANKTFNFTFEVNAVVQTTTNRNQSVHNISLDYCTVGPAHVNFTFKNESDDTNISEVINDLAQWSYWISSGSGTVTKTLITSNTSVNPYYAFCLTPNTTAITADLTFKYSATGFPLRTFSYDNHQLTNSTTNQTLYLLATADGIYTSFLLVNAAGAPIQGVIITIERQFSGVWTVIGQDITGSDGSVTFWVNPNFQHRITAEKSGYTTGIVTITPTQSSYTITLAGTSTSGAEYSEEISGIYWIASPSSGVIQSGSRNFNVTIHSSEANLEDCKFELINASNVSQVLASDSGITNSSYSFLSITYISANNEKIFGRLSLDTTNTTGFVVVDSDWKWSVIDADLKPWRSITSFFSDLSSIGEFGEGNEGEFSRLVAFFLIMTIFIGVFNYFTGIEYTNPGITILFIWGIALFASAGGFLTFESNSIPYNDSFNQKWGIFFIFTLMLTSLWLNKIRKENE